MSTPRPLISAGPNHYQYNSSPALGDHITQIAVDAEGNFSIRSTQNPQAVPPLLRAIADSIESDAQ